MSARIVQLLARYIAMAAAALLGWAGVEQCEGIANEAGTMIAGGIVLVVGVLVDHFLHRVLEKKKVNGNG